MWHSRLLDIVLYMVTLIVVVNISVYMMRGSYYYHTFHLIHASYNW